MKYEDVSWHFGGEGFPKDLPEEAGGTHTGMFAAWALLAGLAGDLHSKDCPEDIEDLRTRSITPGAFFLRCDGKFTDEDLNEEGNAFAEEYFDPEKGRYLADYQAALGGKLPSLYHLQDTWENFDRLKPVLEPAVRGMEGQEARLVFRQASSPTRAATHLVPVPGHDSTCLPKAFLMRPTAITLWCTTRAAAEGILSTLWLPNSLK